MIGILESYLNNTILNPQKLRLKIKKFFVSIEIAAKEALLDTLDVTLVIN